MSQTRLGEPFVKGDLVCFADTFLQGTGQFSENRRGPSAPCHWGYHARGTVAEVRMGTPRLLGIKWADGWEKSHLATHLSRVSISADHEADRLLAVVCADLLLIGSGHKTAMMLNTVADNLLQLSIIMRMGGKPDPFPYLRHGSES